MKRGEKEAGMTPEKPARRGRGLAKLGKRSFFLWIAYQTIKGTLTTVFIWVPLISWYLFSR